MKQPKIKKNLEKINLTKSYIGDIYDSLIEDQQIDFIIKDISIDGCYIKNVDFSMYGFKNIYISDTIFENCNFANVTFINSITRVIFKNCNMVGCNFIDCNIGECTLKECKCDYINIANCKINNLFINESILTYGRFLNNEIKKVNLNEVDLSMSEFNQTSLSNIDLSTSNISGIKTDLYSISGCIIDKMQSIDLVRILDIKFSDEMERG